MMQQQQHRPAVRLIREENPIMSIMSNAKRALAIAAAAATLLSMAACGSSNAASGKSI